MTLDRFLKKIMYGVTRCARWVPTPRNRFKASAATVVRCVALPLAVAFALACLRADAEELGTELVTNGSAESGTTGWSFARYPSEGAQSYGSSSSLWLFSALETKAGVGAKCFMLQCKNSDTSDTMSQSVAAVEAGVYSFSCVYAARVNMNNQATKFWGGTTTVTLVDSETSEITTVAAFTTTADNRFKQDFLRVVFPIVKAGTYTLKLTTTGNSDMGNAIDLISLKRILSTAGGCAAIESAPDRELPSVELVTPTVGTVYSVPAVSNLTRTTSAKCLGYRLYRYTAENGYAPEEPAIVESTSHTVTSTDLASPFRLVWQWQWIDRVYPLDTTPFSRMCEFTVSGYSGSTSLTHFPLLLRLSADNPSGFSYGNVAVGGSDIRFTDADGNAIPHEIDTWNTAGESAIWVRVPSLSGTATKIRMYYGVTDADLPSLPANESTDTWADYTGVWHMDIDKDDYSTRDSTIGGMNGTMSNTWYCDPSARGMVGGAYTNSSTAYLVENFSTQVKRMYGTMVFSAWTYNHDGANYATIWSLQSGYQGFEIIFEGNPNTLTTRPSSSVHSTPTFADCWRHLQVVYENNNVYVYMDGELKSTHTSSAAPNWYTSAGLYVGQRAGNSGCAWKGTLDELRIRSVNTSADWIKAEYENQKPSSSFVAYGEVQKTKKVVLAIADRGFSVTDRSATFAAHLTPVEDEPAVSRVVYGTTEAMTEATESRVSSAEIDLEETLSLDWATAYYQRWEAWPQGKPEDKVTTAMRSFTTDGTPQVANDLVWTLDRNVATVSAELTALRGTDSARAELWRTLGTNAAVLVEAKALAAVGEVTFAADPLQWSGDYAYFVRFIASREGIGTWTNETASSIVRTPSKPAECNLNTFKRHCTLTLSGYRGSEQLRDFPVLVRLSDNSPRRFHYSDVACGAHGEYLCFTDELGGLIPHEVDTWNPSGESLVWVRVPILKGTNTEITLHYDPVTPSRVPSVDSRSVWTNYLAVWHMDVASDWSVRESAAHSLDGSVKNGEKGASTPDDPSSYSYTGSAGLLGGSFTNSNWAYVKVPANSAFKKLTSCVTFSAWVRSSEKQGNYAAIFNNKLNGSSYYANCGTEVILDNVSTISARGYGMSVATLTVPSVSREAWHQVTVAFAGDTLTVYVDDKAGVSPISTVRITPNQFSDTDDLALGQRVGTCKFLGNLDEMRIGYGTQSADWVKAEYDTVANASFITSSKVRSSAGFVIFVQ